MKSTQHFPQFDASLGKDSPTYSKELFEECFLSARPLNQYPRNIIHALKNTTTLSRMSHSWHGYARILWSLYSKERRWNTALPNTVQHVYELFEELYQHHHPSLTIAEDSYKIPPTIHQIWLGSPFPEQYRAWQQTWQSIPGFEYRLWTDADIAGLKLRNQPLYDSARNWGERADIIRYEILHRYGGLYVDTDFACLRPDLIDQFHRSYDFYGALQPLDIMMVCLANGVIGSAPEHPILEATIQYLATSGQQQDLPVWARTGPVPFTKMVCSHIGTLATKDIVLPPTYFFPRTLLDERVEQTWPQESVAVHHWAASWNLPAANVR